MILFKDVCSILGQFRKYFLHWPQKGFTSSTILHMYIHIHFSLGFRKRFFQKLTLECVVGFIQLLMFSACVISIKSGQRVIGLNHKGFVQLSK